MARSFAVLLLALAAATAQKPAPAEPLWKRVLRMAGLATNPVNFRGDADFDRAGDIWIYDRERGVRCQITSDPNYRSPIFLPGDQFLLALRRGRPIRIPAGGGPAEEIRSSESLARLIATDGQSELVLLEDRAPAVHDLISGEVTRLDLGASGDDEQLLADYRRALRVYDRKLYLFVKPMEDRSGAEPLEWKDVFLREAGAEKNVSECDTAPCGQPSLSFDRNRIVYIRGRLR